MQELPYFRFTPQEWQNGDITLESYDIQGLYINVCAYYWIKDCSITKAMLEKKFSNDKAQLKQLFLSKIIKISDDDFIKISFLDNQFDLLSDKRKKRQEAGKIGGLKKSSNARILLKQKRSYKDKDNNKDKDKDKEKIIFDDWGLLFEKWFNYKKERKESYKSEMSKKIFENKLIKLSNNNINIATEIIDQSMGNNWAGIFELKVNKTSTPSEQQKTAGFSVKNLMENIHKTKI